MTRSETTMPGQRAAATGTAAPVDADFPRLAEPYRRELFGHCYRMLGSVHDAEDLVQEVYLRAWRSYDRFEGRSSLRTWLHRIATTACLTALESRRRRPMPTGLGAPSAPGDPLTQCPEVGWLEPAPDALLGPAVPDDPAAIVVGRESVRLAFVAALQHLAPRQRAVLLLREVLGWRAAEVAELLDMTPVAVNSALQRARAQLDRVTPTEEGVVEPAGHQRELLDRYVEAFERKDVPAIVALCAADVVWEMPPFPQWYVGPAAVAEHLTNRCPGRPGDLRLVSTSANRQPAFGLYLRDAGGVFRAFDLQVLTVGPAGLSQVANFLDTAIFVYFGLPLVLPADAVLGGPDPAREVSLSSAPPGA